MTFKNKDEEISDPLEKMLKKTGCMELHFKVQECIAEKQDWRQCQEEVHNFKKFNMETYKMVMIVRNDLNMKAGKVAAQCAHAAIDLYRNASSKSRKGLKSWSMQGEPKIVLKVETEERLLELYEAAKQKGLQVSLIYDAGRTQVSEGTLTVLGIGPDVASDIDEVTKHLKLL